MTLTVDDRELIEALRAEAVSVVLCNEAADRLQSLLSDRDKLRDALNRLSSSFTGGWAGMYRRRADVVAEVESIARTALRSTDNG